LGELVRVGRTLVSERIGRGLIGVVVAVIVGAVSFGWWAADRIDSASVDQQRRALTIGLQEFADRVPVEQDSSAIWDDAVLNVRADNDAWLAENLAEWVSEYFGHDEVYILDSTDRAVRSVLAGQHVADGQYEERREAIEPLVKELRRQMADASAGEVDSTAHIQGLGTLDDVAFANGDVGIVSVRPIIPSTSRVTQAAGTEYLLISVRLFDQGLADDISRKYALADLAFGATATIGSDRPSSPVLDHAGRIVGFFSWTPSRPAMTLIGSLAPALMGTSALVLGALGFFAWRLRRTSALLEASEGNATFLAFHDALTRLPNRALFTDRLRQAIAGWRHSGEKFALHVVDLDRFKRVNDTLGHPAGDELMRQVAQRLRDLITEVDTGARIGGDEFAVVQRNIRDVAEAISLSQRIVAAMEKPFDLKGQEAQIGASVGISVVSESSGDAEDMLREADVALYEAKTSGRGRYQLFAGELDLAVQERRAIELDLRAALNGGSGLELVYQPIYSRDGNTMQGAEALVRWNNPRLGRLSPAIFIPLAEERGLIDALGFWVLRQACSFAAGSSVPWVAVNVSPLQFRNERFAEQVFRVLEETGLPPRRLEIEITEGLLLQNSPAVQATLNHLRAAGVRVALDDFGTGYSSISYLRTHGVDKLKIDQSFVAKLGKDSEIDNIVRCIIGLASAMRMKVTAEGVETEDQAQTLRAMGCDQLQGFLLARPMTPEHINAALEAMQVPELRSAG
jgi:diguanylate cyclase (GGDEF)-like protein